MLFCRVLVRRVVFRMRVQEFVYLVLGNFLDYTEAFLKKTFELLAPAIDLRAVTICEDSPTLSEFSSRPLPLARNLVPAHDGSPTLSSPRGPAAGLVEFVLSALPRRFQEQ